jgi:saccharopine dehydrogenase (NAD+, L-lysine forming)
MKIGILREGKIPPERRVALLPRQCKEITATFTEIAFFVQPCSFRCIADEEYRNAGIALQEDVTHCDILLGIKEVPVQNLIAGKTYFFFSHTIKQQAYNRKLLQEIIAKNITLIDYECLVNPVTGERLIAFGRYAGIVGAYNAIWMYGKKHQLFDLKRAFKCHNYAELQQEYAKIKLPAIKIIITGTGRVGKGVTEVLDGIGIRKVSPEDFLERSYKEPIYTSLSSKDYHYHANGWAWDSHDFHRNPQDYLTDFQKFISVADMLIATAFWHPKAPVLFTKQEAKQADFRIKNIADITCDIEGSVPVTVQCSTIDEPVYDFNPFSETVEPAFSDIEKNISVMAIDNLPCEVPYDASEYFGRQFIEFVLPHFFNHDERAILKNATLTKNGKLTEKFAYLEDFIKLD